MFFSLQKPKKTYAYIFQNGLFFFIVNALLIILFGYIYYKFDTDEISIFEGMPNIKNRKMSEYIYFSTIINTTLGLGEIIPTKNVENKQELMKKKLVSRTIVGIHIFISILINDMLDSFENIKLS
jgi:hypothetical protein